MQTHGSTRIVLAMLALAATIASAGCGSDSDTTSDGGTTGAPTPGEAAPPASTSTVPGRTAPADHGQEAPAGVRADVCRGSAAVGGEVRVTGVPCRVGRLVVTAWSKNDACSSPPGASRTSCKVGSLTCLGAATARGLAVTCAGPGRSIAFLAKPR